MKCLSLEDRELISRARRDGKEARGNEDREKREDREREQREDYREKRKTKRQFEVRDPPFIDFFDLTLRCSHCFFKSSGYDKLELKHQTLVFTSL